MNEQELIAQITQALNQGVSEQQIMQQLSPKLGPEKTRSLISQARQGAGQPAGQPSGQPEQSAQGREGLPAKEALEEMLNLGLNEEQISRIVDLFLSLAHATILEMADMMAEYSARASQQPQGEPNI